MAHCPKCGRDLGDAVACLLCGVVVTPAPQPRPGLSFVLPAAGVGAAIGAFAGFRLGGHAAGLMIFPGAFIGLSLGLLLGAGLTLAVRRLR